MAEKQKQKFENSWTRLTTLTGNQTPEKVAKVDPNSVVAIFQELQKERDEAATATFKLKLKAVLEAKMALDKNVAAKKAELAKFEEQQYEALNKELEACLNQLNNAKAQTAQLVSQAAGNFAPPAGTEGDEDQDKEGKDGE